MKIMAFLKELNISKWSAAWAFLTDGWAGIAELLCKAFTALLKKADADKLKKYSELAAKIATFIRGGIETFLTDGAVKEAAVKTADAVNALAEHLADGEYTTEELDADVKNIEACIKLWQKAGEDEAKAA